MEVSKKAGKPTVVSISKDELLSILDEKADIKKEYFTNSNLPNHIKVTFNFYKKLSKKKTADFNSMLERAGLVEFLDIVDEFRLTVKNVNKDSYKAVNQFCNRMELFFNNKNLKLKEALLWQRKKFEGFRGVGDKSISLFEEFLDTKGYRFAVWNGKEYI
ncbi:MAG: hypothetical protein WC011_01075 [Candidatus Paceibacterota bacterium]